MTGHRIRLPAPWRVSRPAGNALEALAHADADDALGDEAIGPEAIGPEAIGLEAIGMEAIGSEALGSDLDLPVSDLAQQSAAPTLRMERSFQRPTGLTDDSHLAVHIELPDQADRQARLLACRLNGQGLAVSRDGEQLFTADFRNDQLAASNTVELDWHWPGADQPLPVVSLWIED